MLRTLLEQIDTLRARCGVREAANRELSAAIARREGELAAQVERLNAANAAVLGAFLPLLIAKQRKLEELEREVVEKEIVLGDASSDEEEGERSAQDDMRVKREK